MAWEPNGIFSAYLNISRMDDLPLPLIPIRLFNSGDNEIVFPLSIPPWNEMDFIQEFSVNGFSIFRTLFLWSKRRYLQG